jgi:hypothetical protein
VNFCTDRNLIYLPSMVPCQNEGPGLGRDPKGWFRSDQAIWRVLI